MAEYYTSEDSIECASAEIWTRKLGGRAAVNYAALGHCIKYNCDRNSSAEIIKELSPKKASHCKTAHLDNGDSIRSEGLYFVHKGFRPIKFEHGGKHSHTHGAQRAQTREHTFAQITKPFDQIRNAIENRTSKLLPA